MTRLTIGLLDAIGPYLGITHRFRITEDLVDPAPACDTSPPRR